VLWQITSSPVVVGDERDGVVLVEYRTQYAVEGCSRCPRNRTDAEGIAALSIEDGSVVWLRPVIPSVSVDDRRATPYALQTPRRLVANDQVAMLEVLVRRGDGFDNRVAAFDPTTGERLWQLRDVEVAFAVDDVVLGVVRRDPPRGSKLQRAGITVAFDARTGARRWTLGSRDSLTSPMVAVPGVAAVRTTAEGRTLQLVDLNDGSVLSDLPPTVTCRSDGESVIACIGGGIYDPRLTTYDATTATLATSAQEVPSDVLAAVADGYVYVGNEFSPAEERVALDRSANVLSEPLPGVVVRATEQYLVLDEHEPGRTPGSFAAYEIVS